MEGVSRFCFACSYAVALLLEAAGLFRRNSKLRFFGLLFGAAGFLAQTLFLIYHRTSVASAEGSLLALSWVLAIFYLYGTIHHRHLAWAIFVLPLILAMVLLTGPGWTSEKTTTAIPEFLSELRGPRFWGSIHGGLVFLSAIGLCVGCVASVMYLVQARRLRNKSLNSGGLRMLSLERLETMNRRAVNFAFPILTVGLIVGTVLLAQKQDFSTSWTATKFLSAYGLWGVSALLLYLRYGLHVRGRHLAWGTISAFLIMLATLIVAHPLVGSRP